MKKKVAGSYQFLLALLENEYLLVLFSTHPENATK